MAAFLTDLWNSVFTPGPSPSLLVATNVSFAALQLVLLVLLALTYSIHFIVLSILCAGLWWSINWFAAELEIARKEEREKEDKRLDQTRRQRQDPSVEDSDTETEVSKDRTVARESRPATQTTLLPGDAEAKLRKRRSLGSSTGDVSTDSDWDKVSEADA
ncbi:MAG: hypothetical protein Q9183_001932 [Haloplaca sp. 2 TL-2023]